MHMHMSDMSARNGVSTQRLTCQHQSFFPLQASSLLLSSALLMGAAYAPRHGSGIALLTAAAYGAYALSTAGYSAAYFEVCPRCAGQAFAVSNTFATLPGIAAPLIAQGLVSRLGAEDGWRAAFGLFGFGMALPALLALFCCFRAEPFGTSQRLG